MSFWRNKARKQEFKSGGVVPDARLARSFATGGVIADTVVPEVLTPYIRQLVSAKTLLTLAGVEPNFDDVGDTLGQGDGRVDPIEGIDDMPGGGGDFGFSYGECAWCGSSPHKPDCKALSRNYPKSSLSTQREMTERIRTEMAQPVGGAYYQGSGRSAFPARMATTAKPEPPKDVRTEMQKRFDAIAEELEENK